MSIPPKKVNLIISLVIFQITACFLNLQASEFDHKKNASKGNYVIGTWIYGDWTNLNKWPPQNINEYDYIMMGMCSNLGDFTNSNNFGPKSPKPHYLNHFKGKKLWTYGGTNASGPNPPYPKKLQSRSFYSNTSSWDGLDIRDVFDANRSALVAIFTTVKNSGKSTSYTFKAGTDYCNEGPTDQISKKIRAINYYCDRFILICHGEGMWNKSTYDNIIPAAIDKTIGLVGNSRKLILACTSDGLTKQNLKDFINYVTYNNLGGLFIWQTEKTNFTLSSAQMDQIKKGLRL